MTVRLEEKATNPAPCTTFRRGAATVDASPVAPGKALIRSSHRKKTYGEVFTPRSMVNSMLDLVQPQLEDVDKTFLEPAAGDGNFLVEILRRKLAAVRLYFDSNFWVTESLFALRSIYGIELLEDNLISARSAMLEVFCDWHAANVKPLRPNSNAHQAAVYLIGCNIVQGNTLTKLQPGGSPIVFSWWHREATMRAQVRREVFTFRSMFSTSSAQDSLFELDSLLEDAFPAYSTCRIDHVHKEMVA